MKLEASREVKKVADRIIREGSGGAGVRGSEEGVSSSPFALVAAAVGGLPPPSTTQQVPSWSRSRLFSDHCLEDDLARVPSSSLASASGLWSFGSTRTSQSLSATNSRASTGQLTGMNRWNGEANKQLETPETAGGKADSADSSLGSTISKKTKIDIKLRTNQVSRTHFKVENFPTPARKQSMSRNNEGGTQVDVQQDRGRRKQTTAAPGESLLPEKQVSIVPQKNEREESVFQEQVFDMHYIRETILEQEAVFREQVRELHRVHKVQTLLMAEMRKKDSNFMSHSSGTNIGGSCQSPAAFAINSARWDCAVGEVLNTTVKEYETFISLPEHLKGGSAIVQRDSTVNRLPQEANLSEQNARVPPIRRTFDLERPPEDDDDEQTDHKGDENFKSEGDCVRFMESPASCNNEPESDISLHLSTGWSRGKAVNNTQGHSKNEEDETSRASKRPREEAALFQFLATQSERLQDTPVRPTPTMATQSFLGGLWGLQLGRKQDSSLTVDGNNSPGSEVPNEDRHSLNLEVEERAPPATPANSAPHWLLKAPAAKPSKKAVCQTESSSLNFQDSFSPPRNSSEQGIMKSPPSESGGEPGSGSGPGLVWDGRQVTDNSPRSQTQSSHNARRIVGEDVQAGMRGVYRSPVVAMGSTVSVSTGYGRFQLAQGVGEVPREALTLYSSWREVGEVPCTNFAHGVFTHSHPVAGGFGVQLRGFEGHAGFAGQELAQVGPPRNIDTGSTTFLPDSGSGMWYQQRNLTSHVHQYQQQQQFASLQAETLSSSCQRPCQAPVRVPEGVAYGKGTVYAIPAAGGPSLGFHTDGFRKTGGNIPGQNWTSGSVGPQFKPFSIVVPPRPPFQRPPKLVLTHDGTTMELKLVPPEREVAGKVVAVEKSFSGSSNEETGEKRVKGTADGVPSQGEVRYERDDSLRPRGSMERDNRASMMSPLKEKGSPASGGGADGMVTKVSSNAAHRAPQARRVGVQHVSTTVVAMAHQEGMDDADGGSSDAGSGGSGVGDVINPGDRASPPLGTFVAGGSNGHLPAGEGEEGINMGELGLQADSESQSETFDRKSLKDKSCKLQEDLQEQLTASFSFGSGLSMTVKRICRENSDESGPGVDSTQKRVRGRGGLSEEGEESKAVFQREAEQSNFSSGATKNFLDEESQSHCFCPAQQSIDELRSAQLELKQPTSSTSQPRMIHTSKLQDYGNQGKESLKAAEGSLSGHRSTILKEHFRGTAAMDSDDTGRGKTIVDQRITSFSNSGDVCKQEIESKPGRSKQLSGASTSEKDVLLQACSPALRQVSSPPSMVETERHAEGSSTKVSQASETVQGNGRSPLRTSELIEPTSLEQNHFHSTGGISSSCEEVDGTLVKRLQQGKIEQKGNDGSYAVQLAMQPTS